MPSAAAFLDGPDVADSYALPSASAFLDQEDHPLPSASAFLDAPLPHQLLETEKAAIGATEIAAADAQQAIEREAASGGATDALQKTTHRAVTHLFFGDDEAKRQQPNENSKDYRARLMAGDTRALRPTGSDTIVKGIDALTGLLTGDHTPTMQQLQKKATRPAKASDQIIPNIPPQEEVAGQIAAGVANTGIGFANFLLSPEGVAVVQGTGMLPKLAQTLLGAGFTLQAVNEFIHAPDLQSRITSGVGAALIGAGTTFHAVNTKGAEAPRPRAEGVPATDVTLVEKPVEVPPVETTTRPTEAAPAPVEQAPSASAFLDKPETSNVEPPNAVAADVPTVAANELRPALRTTEGQVIEGEQGKTHQDIYDAQPDPTAMRASDPAHGFIDPQGKFHTREEAGALVGEPGALQSERLAEMQQPKPAAKPVEQMSPEAKAELDNKPTVPHDDLLDATAPTGEWAAKLKGKLGKNEGGFIDPPTLREVVDFGGRVYRKGIEYAQWATEMVRHLGEKVRPHLQAAWDSLIGRDILPHARERGSIGSGFKIGKMSELDRATTERSAKLQRSTDDARRAEAEFSRVTIPPKRVATATGTITTGKPKIVKLAEPRRNAITIYAEAAGDKVKLADWAAKAKGNTFRQAARDALTLTPEEVKLADRARTVFDTLEGRGNAYEVLKGHKDNYVPHVWDLKKGKDMRPGGGGRTLQNNFRHAKARTLETIFDGDQAGLVPKTLDISKLLPAYLSEMNKVIADRQFVQDLADGRTGKDGRPLVMPRGLVKVEETADGGKVYLANPDARLQAKDAKGNPIDTSDYEVMPKQPALKQWLWKGKEEAGNPIFMRSDLSLHPEAQTRLNAMLGKSQLRGTKWIDATSRAMKREMFSFLAPFHQVQEGTHAVGHLVNPFFGLKDVDFRSAAVADSAKHGLMLQPEGKSYGSFIEGVGTDKSFLTRALRKIPGPTRVLADIADGYQDYLFHSYIPRLKYTTYEHIRGRNMKRYAPEIARGEVSEADVKLLSSEQTNAAYGHLNLALLERNPTVQHMMQLGGLAPDFLEARIRFTGQAMRGLVDKSGREQLKAVAVLAGIQAGSAFILSQLLPDAEYDWKDPFSVTIGKRKLTMRSVPEDLFKLSSELVNFGRGRSYGIPFVSARINPVLQSAIQLITGYNYRGEKTTAATTAGEFITKFIPITLRELPIVRDLTATSRNNPVSPLEKLAGSFGFKVSRTSPITDTYQLANAWKRSQGIEDRAGTYPVSAYSQLHYALEDANFDKAKTEWEKLRASRMSKEGELPGAAERAVTKGFKMHLNHPFAGSQDKDEDFGNSLKGEDRATFDAAVQRRKDIWYRLLKLKEAGVHGKTGF